VELTSLCDVTETSSDASVVLATHDSNLLQDVDWNMLVMDFDWTVNEAGLLGFQ
jgi:hypothetical protein